jgi:hypothetical protein
MVVYRTFHGYTQGMKQTVDSAAADKTHHLYLNCRDAGYNLDASPTSPAFCTATGGDHTL